MKSSELFRQRVISDFMFQRQVIGTVIDWVIAIYLFIPGIFIIPLLYLEFWENVTQYWHGEIAFVALIAIMLLFSLSSQIRTFLVEADILFLLQEKNLYEGLRKYGFIYSIIHFSLVKVILLLLISPILLQVYHFTWLEVFCLFCFLLGFELLITILKKVITRPIWLWLGVVLPLYLLALFLVGNLTIYHVGWIGIAVILAISFMCLFQFVPSKQYFFQEVSFEGKYRLRYAKFIINLSTGIEKRPIRIRKRPFILRRSQRFIKIQTPENGLLEVLLKGFLRHSVYLSSYLRLTMLTFGAIVILPVWGKWIIFLVFWLFLQYNDWLKGLFERLIDEDFFQIVPFDAAIQKSVWLRFKRILTIPVLVLLGGLTVLLSLLPIL